ncbi:hypothetical protein C8J57DRAFT_1563660, partial [Mycena rebaudengoi]
MRLVSLLVRRLSLHRLRTPRVRGRCHRERGERRGRGSGHHCACLRCLRRYACRCVSVAALVSTSLSQMAASPAVQMQTTAVTCPRCPRPQTRGRHLAPQIRGWRRRHAAPAPAPLTALPGLLPIRVRIRIAIRVIFPFEVIASRASASSRPLSPSLPHPPRLHPRSAPSQTHLARLPANAPPCPPHLSSPAPHPRLQL